jgi:hypothetical protein
MIAVKFTPAAKPGSSVSSNMLNDDSVIAEENDLSIVDNLE